MPPSIDARVIETPHGFIVRPPDVFKHAGDVFTISNLTGSRVAVTFPVLPTNPAQATISPGETGQFTILSTTPGIYDYLVEIGLSDGTRGFTQRASGASDPHIIIDF
jgi:hypothetical protein